MKLLSEEEAKVWCVERGLRLDGGGQPHFPHTPSKGLQMPLPEAPSMLPYLVLYLLSDVSIDEFNYVSGGEYLLWLHDWSIWNDEMRLIGVSFFDRLRL